MVHVSLSWANSNAEQASGRSPQDVVVPESGRVARGVASGSRAGVR